MRLFPFLGHKAKRDKERILLLEQIPKDAVCAEIGVWKGDYSQQILETARPSALHLIDPWLFEPSFPGRMYGGKLAKNQSDMDAIYEAVRTRFSGAPEVHLHRQKSAEAASSFTDGYFDWVYIDGDHSFEAVRQDLDIWARKIKPGGYLTGDDYRWRNEKGERSVRRAVDEFMSNRKLPGRNTMITQFIVRP